MSRVFLPHVITDDSALGGMKIERSLRFNSVDNAYLTRTVTTTSNRKTSTYSAWVKRTKLSLSASNVLLGSNVTSGVSQTSIGFDTNETFTLRSRQVGSTNGAASSTEVYRDTSAWYHVLFVIDTTQSTQTDRMKLYVNGEQLTISWIAYPAQDSDLNINVDGSLIQIGAVHYNGSQIINRGEFYLAEVNFVDGQALDPSYFGFTDTQTGIWMPKRYEGTYGTNGFYLDFSDNSSTAALGIDRSPNGNDFTVNNFSVSSGVGDDSSLDTPTNNFPTLNPLNSDPYSSSSYTPATLTNGNLQYTTNTTSLNNYVESSIYFPRSGKWYLEITLANVNIGSGVGYAQIDVAGYYLWWHYASPYYEIQTVSGKQTIGSLSNDDIIQVAYDVDSGYIWYGKNNSWYLSGDPSSGTPMSPAAQSSNSNGDVRLFLNGRTGSGTNIMHVNFGSRPFNYTPPTGFKALSTKNVRPNAAPVIKPKRHFGTLFYTGNGSTNHLITGLEFKPDFVWIKSRSQGSGDHGIHDSVRKDSGNTTVLYANSTSAESTGGSLIKSTGGFVSNGIRVNNNTNGNNNGSNYVAWCWKAGGAAVTNTVGNISAQVSANDEAGFSIITYTGDGNSSGNVGTGLRSTQPLDWAIVKRRDSTSDWQVGHSASGQGVNFAYHLNLNSTDQLSGSSPYHMGTQNATNGDRLYLSEGGLTSSATYVAYVWQERPGYSKFGSYTGNGSSSNPTYVDLGFRPAFVMVKSINASEHWNIPVDTYFYNGVDKTLSPNLQNAERDMSGGDAMDFLSNGFKIRNTDNNYSNDGKTFIYMAFAEQPGFTNFDTFPNAR